MRNIKVVLVSVFFLLVSCFAFAESVNIKLDKSFSYLSVIITFEENDFSTSVFNIVKVGKDGTVQLAIPVGKAFYISIPPQCVEYFDEDNLKKAEKKVEKFMSASGIIGAFDFVEAGWNNDDNMVKAMSYRGVDCVPTGRNIFFHIKKIS